MKCLIYFILYDWYIEPFQGSLLINSVLPEPPVELRSQTNIQVHNHFS